MRFRKNINEKSKETLKQFREWLNTTMLLVDIIITLILGVLVYTLTNKQTSLMDSQTKLMDKQTEVTKQQYRIDSSYNVIYTELYKQQNKFLEQQTQLAELELNRNITTDKVQNEAAWSNLKNAVMDLEIDIRVFIGDHWSERFRRDSTTLLFNDSETNKIKDFIRRLYELEANPAFIQNDSCLRHWRNAINTTDIISELMINNYPATQEMFDFARNKFQSIDNDIFYVLDKMILRKKFDWPLERTKNLLNKSKN